MILKSLIQDDSTLAIDCAKTRMCKGSVIEIKDEFWPNAEIQGAIRLGMIALIGQAPKIQQEPELEQEQNKIKFRNVSDTKIAFECIIGYEKDGKNKKWSDYVAPNEYIFIPEAATHSRQVQNALGWGMIVFADEKGAFKQPVKSAPVELDELTIQDAIQQPVKLDPVKLDEPIIQDPVKLDEPIIQDPVKILEPEVANPVVNKPKTWKQAKKPPMVKKNAIKEDLFTTDNSNPFDAIYGSKTNEGSLPSSEEF